MGSNETSYFLFISLHKNTNGLNLLGILFYSLKLIITSFRPNNSTAYDLGYLLYYPY